jgi:hypothetical protein
VNKNLLPLRYQHRIAGKHYLLAFALAAGAGFLLWNMFVGPLNRDLTASGFGRGTQPMRDAVVSIVVAFAATCAALFLAIRGFLQRPVAGVVGDFGALGMVSDCYGPKGYAVSHIVSTPIYWAHLRPRGHGNTIRFVYLTEAQFNWLKEGNNPYEFDPKTIDRWFHAEQASKTRGWADRLA